MGTTGTALDADWLELCRRSVEGLAGVLAAAPTTIERARETGTRGSGGDRTLEIDSSAESVVFAQLQALYDQGHRFSAISEERGEVDFGGGGVRVIVDPIDGSLNAKRDACHYALSVASRSCMTSARASSGGPGAARARGATACRWIPRCPSAARATAGSSCWGSSPQTRAGCMTRSTR
jgi:myo-inositol-1(or 4)-monophosphatase